MKIIGRTQKLQTMLFSKSLLKLFSKTVIVKVDETPNFNLCQQN